jgi:hypothetical protein
MKKLLLPVILAIILFQSCSITPRYHSLGYQVEWNRSKQHRVNSERNHTAKELRATAIKIDQNPAKLPTRFDENGRFTESKATVITKQEQALICIDQRTPINCKHFINQTVETLFHNLQNNHNLLTPLKPRAKIQLHKYRKNNKYGPKSIPDPGDPLYIFYIVLGIIGSIFGYDRYDAGGPGISIDWTIFFAIASLVVALTGFILLLAMKSASGTLALWAMIKFFTIIGLPLSVIGFIKSVNQFYEPGKYFTIASVALLAAMWIIGLAL